MKESKCLVTFKREEKFADGKKVDDCLFVTYYPNKENKWSSTSFILSTNELEDFVKALNCEFEKLKETETQYTKSLILGTNLDVKDFGGDGSFGTVTKK